MAAVAASLQKPTLQRQVAKSASSSRPAPRAAVRVMAHKQEQKVRHARGAIGTRGGPASIVPVPHLTSWTQRKALRGLRAGAFC